MEQTIDHDALDDALRRCGATWDAPQAHGLLSGRLATTGAEAGFEWLALVLDGTDTADVLRRECPVSEKSNLLPKRMLAGAKYGRVLTQAGKLLVVQPIIFFDQLTDQLNLGQKKLEQVHIGLNGFTAISRQKDQETAAIGHFRGQLCTDHTAALDGINARIVAIINLTADHRQDTIILVQKRNAAGMIGAKFAFVIYEHQDRAFQLGHAKQMAFKLLCQCIYA